MLTAEKHPILGAMLCALCVISVSLIPKHAPASEGDLKTLGEVAAEPAKAATVIKALQQDPKLSVTQVLEAMRDTSAISQNWYLSLAQTIADRDKEAATKELEQFLPRLSEEPNARYWAFAFLTQGDASKRDTYLESMLADPCLELRYAAVEQALAKAKEAELNEEQMVARYRELLAAARLPAQVDKIAGLLEEKNVDVDLLEHFGFVAKWMTTGPFDNSDANKQVGFDEAYPPEEEFAAGKLDVVAKYEGKSGEVSWKEISTEEKDGAVDLAAFYNKEKGAVSYCFANFKSESDLECEVRIGSPNACKVWVNGKLCIDRKVYHSGNQVDQYTAPVRLNSGINSVLVKVCQKRAEGILGSRMGISTSFHRQ